jgi:AcrR family transcriptional regulator
MPTEKPHDSRRRRRLSAAERRQTILDAALVLFAERGYEAASMDDIAAQAGITVAVIYSHFKSKEELHRSVLNEQWQSVIAYQGQAAFTIPPGRDRLNAAYTAFFEWFEDHPLAWRLVFHEIAGPPAVVRAQEEVLAMATQAVVAYLAAEEPADQRLSSEPGMVIAAEYIKGAVNSVARWWLDHRDVPREEIIDLLVDLTWGGLAPLGVEGKKRPSQRGKKTSKR